MAYSMTSTADGHALAGRSETRVWGADPGELSRIGIVSILAGAVALILPGVATVAIEWLIGLTLVVIGAFEALHALPYDKDRGSAWHLGLGVIALAGGVMFMISPLTGAITLTLIVGLMFTAAGLAKTGFSISARRLSGWGWAFGSGLLTLAVGLMILFLLPVISPWFLGVLVGLELLINGIWMLFLGRRSSSADA
ncbi:HdeD family acid-resistance protein [Roseospira navarrensis]|nr:DUF308 domain-containing protein [Roseospira navarrensis]